MGRTLCLPTSLKMGAAFVMWGLVLALTSSPARAGSCSSTADTTTCTFNPTGTEDTFVVPAGVHAINVLATGAPGAVGQDGVAGGSGATVIGVLPVTPGDTLYVEVGGAPTGSETDCPLSQYECIGGFNGGGSSDKGGGAGGGASDVRTISSGQSGSLQSRLIVAGGGGGPGQAAICEGNFLAGPDGGDAGFPAGSPGEDGASCGSLAGGTGGGGGTQSEGGAFGIPNCIGLGVGCVAASLGQGGVSVTGGGGGGGYYGGGGGGTLTENDNSDTAPAGGGGGGSNLMPEGGVAAIFSELGPSVAISYQTALGGEEPPPEPENKQAKPIADPPDAKCAKLAIKTLGPSYNPSKYTFHGGTAGDDVFTGQATAGPDVFCGFGGVDGIQTLDEGDIFLGGAGNDSVRDNFGSAYGQEGDDQVIRNFSGGTFNGGPGDDFVFGNLSGSTFNGGPGEDTVGSGNPPVDGSP